MTEEQKQQIVNEFKTIALGDLILESEKAGLTLRQHVKRQLRAGVSPYAVKNFLLTDLREGGQIFGSFRKSFRQTVTNTVERTGSTAKNFIQEQRKVQLYDWVIEASPNNCDDCLSRSGMSAKTMENWQAVGVPQAGMTLCGQYCNCELVESGVYTQDMMTEVKKQYAERIST